MKIIVRLLGASDLARIDAARLRLIQRLSADIERELQADVGWVSANARNPTTPMHTDVGLRDSP